MRLTITKESDPDADHPTVVGDITLSAKEDGARVNRFFLVRNCGRDCHVLIEEPNGRLNGIILSGDTPRPVDL